MARFTVLTDKLIRMEYARRKGHFEDRASLAVLHRATATPQRMTHSEANGVLTITTGLSSAIRTRWSGWARFFAA